MQISLIITLLLNLTIILGFVVYSFLLKKQEEETYITNQDNIVKEPSSGVHTHTMIFIHGLGTAPELYEESLKKMDIIKRNTTKIIYLRAPTQNITCYGGISDLSWFDIYYMPLNSSSAVNLEEFKKASDYLYNEIKKEAEILGGQFDKIIIGGHSQGGCLSLSTAYSMEEMIGGVISFSGVLFPEIEIKPGKEKLNVYYAYGDADTIIIPSLFEDYIERIKDYEGFKKYVYPNHKHSIIKDEKNDAQEFINKIME